MNERLFEFRVELPSKAPPILRISTPAGPAESPPQLGAEPREHSPYRADSRPTSPCPTPFELRTERPLDRLGKRLLINKEIQLGDPDFDAAVYIECDAPESFVQNFLQNPAAREATLQCLKQGADRLLLDERGWLTFCMVIQYKKAFPNTTEGREILATLGQLSEALPALRGTLRVTHRSELLPVASILWAILGFFVTLFAAWRWETMDNEALRLGALIGLACWVLSLPVSLLVLRGHSTSLRSFLITVLCNLWGLPILGMTLLLSFNGAFLDTPVESTRVQVIRSWASKGSKSTTYSLEVVAPGEAPTQISVESRIYYRFLSPQPARLEFRTGRLGWRMLVDVKRFE